MVNRDQKKLEESSDHGRESRRLRGLACLSQRKGLGYWGLFADDGSLHVSDKFINLDLVSFPLLQIRVNCGLTVVWVLS